MWENKLAEMTEIKAMSYENSGAGHSSDISSPVVRYAEQREKIRTIISAKLKEISFVEREILEYIAGIDDSLIRQIMTLRHIELKSWQQIANIIGNNTADSIRKMHKRYLQHNL